MLDEHSLAIKQEDFDNCDYSIYSDDDQSYLHKFINLHQILQSSRSLTLSQ